MQDKMGFAQQIRYHKSLEDLMVVSRREHLVEALVFSGKKEIFHIVFPVLECHEI